MTELSHDIALLVITFTCVGVFVATALASVLNLFNFLKLERDIRKKLHIVLLAEIVVIGTTAFAGVLRSPTNVIDKANQLEQTSQQDKRRAEVSTSLLKATNSKTEADGEHKASNIDRVIQYASQPQPRGANVLWVDDNPDGQRYEREALSKMGFRFTLAKSTDEAMEKYSRGRFDLVITDFSRRDASDGGYQTLDAVKQRNPGVPVIIYSSSSNPDFVKAAIERGAVGETNRPAELFNLAISATMGRSN